MWAGAVAQTSAFGLQLASVLAWSSALALVIQPLRSHCIPASAQQGSNLSLVPTEPSR